MAGMLQILTYLLAVHLVVKGFEVLQIGLACSREQRGGVIGLGVLVLLGCLVAAGAAVVWQDQQAAVVSGSTGGFERP